MRLLAISGREFATVCKRSLLGLLLTIMSVTVYGGTIDPDSADGFVALSRKVQCSLEDASPQVFEWSGNGYSRVPGERDRKLFGLMGMNLSLIHI